MKILFANNYAYLRGGSERVLFDEMSLLRANDISTLIYSRAHPNNDHWESQEFFPPHLEYDQNVFNKLKTAGELIYSRAAANGLRSLLKRHRPDLLHGHNIYGRLTTSVLETSKAMDIPAVMTLHDCKLVCPTYLLMRDGHICELCINGNFYQCLLKKCHKGSLAASAVYVAESYFTRYFKKYDSIRLFICPSKFLLTKHLQGGVAREKLVYIPNFIDTTNFTPHYSGGDYALFVGRLSKEKGIKTLLRAMQELNIPLKIAGDGPIRQELERNVSKQGLEQIIFEGYQSGEALRSLFQKAAFLVLPSECYENAPMTILEAYGYGKPVIGAEIGGIPEMIVDGETGFLFPAGDAETLRDKINLLWSRPDLVSEMGKNARQLVEVKYNSALHLEKLLEVYQSALT